MKIPISIFKNRIKQAIGQLQEEKLSALVVYSTGSSLGFSSRTHGYCRFLCDWDARTQAAVLILLPKRDPVLLVRDWDARTQAAVLILLPKRDPVLLVPGRSPQLFAKEIMWFNDIRAIPQDEFGGEIVATLKPILLGGEKIGFIGRSETPVPLYDALREGLERVELVEANHIVDKLRIVKDSLAIDFHRRSAEVCDAMFDTLKREIRSGKMVYQIQADLEYTAKYGGCEYASTFMSVGSVADRPRYAKKECSQIPKEGDQVLLSDRPRYAKKECSQIPKEGDQVLLSLFVLKDGHWGHAIRTGTIGEPSRSQQKAFEIALEMQDAALDQLTPGNYLNEVWKASEKVLRKYYPNARDSDWYWLKTGHSLGLDYSDPILSAVFPNPYTMGRKSNEQDAQDESSIRILPGMLFELHPNIFIPGEATAAIGNMVLATESGHEIVDRFPRELMVL
jgi:Xaa-Pro aminopeptidase